MHRLSLPAFALAALAAAAPPLLAQQPRRLKVFISVDMEGLAGVVSGVEVSASGPDYAHFRAIMAGETNAAVDGAFRAGATEVLVRDCTATSAISSRRTSIHARVSCAVRAPDRRT